MFFRITLSAALLLAPLSASAQPQTETRPSTVEERLQRLEDEATISRIIQDYAVFLTSRDFDSYVELFSPEGTWRNGDLIRKGRDEIRQMLVNIFSETPAGYVNNDNYMLVSNIRIDLNGDRATAHSRQLTIMRGKDGTPAPVLSGMYEDEFIRENGQWKILHRNDITFIPTREQWGKMMEEGILDVK